MAESARSRRRDPVCELPAACGVNPYVKYHNIPGYDHVVFGYEDPQRNLFRNWDFENPLTDDDWIIRNADATRSSDAHTGNWSLHVYSRKDKHGQAYQRVHSLKRNTDYYYSFFIKLLSHPPQDMYFQVKVFIVIKFPNKEVKKKEKVCWLNFQQAPSEWQQVGGDFRTPNDEFEYIETHMEVDSTDVEFLVDSASLIELVPDPDWRETANVAIDKHRKSNMTLKIHLPRNMRASDFEVKVKQTKREFGIGSAISADAFNAEGGAAYRECFFKHFEWAVFCNDTKWTPMEPRKGKIRFDRVDRALEKLHEKGITVRGHTIHWNHQKNFPPWVQDLEGAELQAEVDRRTQYVVEHFKSRLVQWDVCNETLHNHFLEERTGKVDQLEHLFRSAHRIDPDCQLYLNDYLVFRGGLHTSGQLNLARRMLAAGSPVHGIGVQSHLRSVPIYPEILKKRIEVVAAAGLPLMITEMSVHTTDVAERARSLEKAMYMYFSHPAINGVIFWHFSDQKGITMIRDEDMALFEGPDFKPNEAGRVLQRLLGEWRTDVTLQPTRSRSTETIRAFHGQYEIEVVHRGSSVWRHSIKLERGQDMTLDINVDDATTDQQPCGPPKAPPTGGEVCVEQAVE